MSTRVETSRELKVPVETAYAQWTQFEDMKLYMDGVESARQLSDDLLRVTYKRRGVERTWDARITEQIPNARIAWESDSDDPRHAGVVTFHRLDDSTSKIMVQFDFAPTGFFEHYADKVGLVERYLTDALDGFQAFIEDRKRPTGSWDGIIGRDDLTTSEAQDGGTTAATPSTGTDTPPPPPSADDRITADPRVPTPDPTLAKSADAAPTPPAPATSTGQPGRETGEPETEPETETVVRQMADGEIVIEEKPESRSA